MREGEAEWRKGRRFQAVGSSGSSVMVEKRELYIWSTTHGEGGHWIPTPQRVAWFIEGTDIELKLGSRDGEMVHSLTSEIFKEVPA